MPATSIDSLIAAFALRPHELQVFDPRHPVFDAQRPLLVLPEQFAEAAPLLAERYPAGHEARAATGARPSPFVVEALPVEAAAWLIAPLAPERDLRSFAGLRAVMERLYGPDGCPWDREQTHESLRQYTLEETYELVDAIDRGDLDGMREELGDLLAHILMHTSMAQQSGEFRLEDAIESSARKMVRRHPHVFGDEQYESEDVLLDRWDEIKAEERSERASDTGTAETAERPAGALDSVPVAAPALMRAQALIGRALRAGLDAPSVSPRDALRDAVEALGATSTGTASGTSGGSEIGALLWHAVALARESDIDAEEALREAAGRFAERFRALEVAALAGGAAIAALEQAERAGPWRAVTGEE